VSNHYIDPKGRPVKPIKETIASFPDDGAFGEEVEQLMQAVEIANQIGRGTGDYSLKNTLAGAIMAIDAVHPFLEYSYLVSPLHDDVDPAKAPEAMRDYMQQVSQGDVPVNDLDPEHPTNRTLLEARIGDYSFREPLPLLTSGPDISTTPFALRDAPTPKIPMSPEELKTATESLQALTQDNALLLSAQAFGQIPSYFTERTQLAEVHLDQVPDTLDASKTTVAARSNAAEKSQQQGVAI